MPDLTVSSSVDTFMQSADQAAMRSAIGVAFTQPSGSSLIQSGAFPVTLTATGSTNVTLPVSGTLASTASKLSVFAATTSSELRGVISDETGTGSLVFATAPTLVSPNIGAATAVSINNVTITAPASSATLTLGNGSSLTVSGGVSLASTGSVTLTLGANNITFSTTGASSVTLPSTGTLATLAGSETLSSKTLSSCALGTPVSGTLTNCTGYPASALSGIAANMATFLGTPSSANLRAAVTDETGTGSLVFATSPVFTTPNLGVATATSLAVGNITSTGSILTSSGLIGYASGNGDSVTQSTSSSTSVTINARCGQIQMYGTVSINPEEAVTFRVNNNYVSSNDVILVCLKGGTDSGNTSVNVIEVGDTYFDIRVSNNNGATGSTETGSDIRINFAIFKSTIASP